MTLRTAVAGDLAALASLELECFGADAWSAESLRQELSGVPATRHLVVAHDAEDGLIGYGALMALGETADVHRIAVAPDRRRSGLGGRLLQALLTEASLRGCTTVLLEVAADNVAAVAMYTRAGFATIHRRASYYGRGRDALVMARPSPSRLR